MEIFNIALYQPLFNILIFLYNFIPPRDLGISVIILTFFIKVVVSPLSIKAYKVQKVSAGIQSKIKEIKERHKGNIQKQNEETMKLYKESGINPFSGCLPMLIQLPIFIALFQILKGFADPNQFSNLYHFVQNPGVLDTSFLGLADLAQKNEILAILAGIFQFIQSKMISSLTKQQKNISMKGGQAPHQSKHGMGQAEQMSQIMAKQMTYMMPIFIVFIYWSLPSALSLYWISFTIFSIGEQYYINKKIKA